MILSLWWKEFREQRGLWLAVAVLAVLLVFAIAAAANGGVWQAHADHDIRQALLAIVASLVIGHGAVCGAMLLAGEKETGTLAFLDTLAPQRGPVWRSKVFMGLALTLPQSLLLAGLAASLQLTTWGFLVDLVLLGLVALTCGLAGGAVCKSVLPAVLVGVALTIVFLLLALFVSVIGAPAAAPFILVGSALLAGTAAWREFCRADGTRTQTENLNMRRPWTGRTVHVVWWLAFRQGRWILVGGLIGSIVAGLLTSAVDLYVWAGATLFIGMACGIAAFAGEQPARQESFLAAQRVPPGTLWTLKTAFWMLAAMGMAAALLVTFIVSAANNWRGNNRSDAGILVAPFVKQHLPLFVVQWAVYGFCFGQFFSLLTRKIVVAVVVSGAASCVVLALWLPSMIFGGLSAWQILAIPIFILFATRLTMWTWYSGRLYERRHLAGLAGCAGITIAWLGGNFWYRVAEVPYVVDPFDLPAYEETLKTSAHSTAPSAIRQAVRTWRVEKGPQTGKDREIQFKLPLIAEKGWPVGDVELGRWFDARFSGTWVKEMRTAVGMPLGLLADPRSPLDEPFFKEATDYPEIAGLICARALQLQARGDNAAALEHLEVALGLARQMRHDASDGYAHMAMNVQMATLTAFDQWLLKVGPRADLLRRAVDLMRRHEADAPSVSDALKADYVARRRYPGVLYEFRSTVPWERRLGEEAGHIPWERERYIRILNAVYGAQFRDAHAYHQAWLARQEEARKYADSLAHLACFLGLPMTDGPTASLSASRWGAIIDDAKVGFDPHVADGCVRNLAALRIRVLLAAAALYQTEIGRAPEKLDDLVDRYLPALPLNPLNGDPFLYRISTGENIEGIFHGKPGSVEKRGLSPGQGVIWMEGRNEVTQYFPLPAWKKK